MILKGHSAERIFSYVSSIVSVTETEHGTKCILTEDSLIVVDADGIHHDPVLTFGDVDTDGNVVTQPLDWIAGQHSSIVEQLGVLYVYDYRRGDGVMSVDGGYSWKYAPNEFGSGEHDAAHGVLTCNNRIFVFDGERGIDVCEDGVFRLLPFTVDGVVHKTGVIDLIDTVNGVLYMAFSGRICASNDNARTWVSICRDMQTNRKEYDPLSSLFRVNYHSGKYYLHVTDEFISSGSNFMSDDGINWVTFTPSASAYEVMYDELTDPTKCIQVKYRDGSRLAMKQVCRFIGVIGDRTYFALRIKGSVGFIVSCNSDGIFDAVNISTFTEESFNFLSYFVVGDSLYMVGDGAVKNITDPNNVFQALPNNRLFGQSIIWHYDADGEYTYASSNDVIVTIRGDFESITTIGRNKLFPMTTELFVHDGYAYHSPSEIHGMIWRTKLGTETNEFFWPRLGIFHEHSQIDYTHEIVNGRLFYYVRETIGGGMFYYEMVGDKFVQRYSNKNHVDVEGTINKVKIGDEEFIAFIERNPDGTNKLYISKDMVDKKFIADIGQLEVKSNSFVQSVYSSRFSTNQDRVCWIENIGIAICKINPDFSTDVVTPSGVFISRHINRLTPIKGTSKFGINMGGSIATNCDLDNDDCGVKLLDEGKVRSLRTKDGYAISSIEEQYIADDGVYMRGSILTKNGEKYRAKLAWLYLRNTGNDFEITQLESDVEDFVVTFANVQPFLFNGELYIADDSYVRKCENGKLRNTKFKIDNEDKILFLTQYDSNTLVGYADRYHSDLEFFKLKG